LGQEKGFIGRKRSSSEAALSSSKEASETGGGSGGYHQLNLTSVPSSFSSVDADGRTISVSHPKKISVEKSVSTYLDNLYQAILKLDLSGRFITLPVDYTFPVESSDTACLLIKRPYYEVAVRLYEDGVANNKNLNWKVCVFNGPPGIGKVR
jgi:hypothetical protein